MKIIHRYILSQFLKNVGVCLLIVVGLFLVFDFFDRLDNIVGEDAPLTSIVQYFIFKIPLTLSLMLPVAMMGATLLTIGLLSRHGEVTALRASGITVRLMAIPILVSGLLMSALAILVNETVVPYAQRRSREVYNIDIKHKDMKGSFNQSDFWWRSKNEFYSVGTFDSRSNTLHDISIFEMSPEFQMVKRTDAARARWVDPILGWTMHAVNEYRFGHPDAPLEESRFKVLPLPISEKPSDFYEIKTDPNTMSFRELRKFIKAEKANGLSVTGYLPYLHEKFSFPLFNFIAVLVVLPFALRPARSGSLAGSIIAALLIGFSYYAVHSFSLAMGKAEIWPAVLSAWMANLVMGMAGTLLMLGAESP